MEEQEIRALRVEELKTKLREQGLPLTGNEKALIERLLTFLKIEIEGGVSDDDFADTNSREGGASRQERLLRQNPVTEQERSQPSTFKFRDLEDAIPNFTGENMQDFVQWSEEFEDICVGLGFNRVQQFVFVRRLMSGSAKLFIQFEIEVSSAEVHRRLKSRRKQVNETNREYLYKLIEIAKPIAIDDASLIDYFIAGLKDEKVNKVVLY